MCTQDFVYPAGLAVPIGGARESMIEMHYDNPDMTEGESIQVCNFSSVAMVAVVTIASPTSKI